MSTNPTVPEIDYSLLQLDPQIFNQVLLQRLSRETKSTYFNGVWQQATALARLNQFIREKLCDEASGNITDPSAQVDFRQKLRKLFKKQRREMANCIEQLDLEDLLVEVYLEAKELQGDASGLSNQSVYDPFADLAQALNAYALPELKAHAVESYSGQAGYVVNKLYDIYAELHSVDAEQLTAEQILAAVFVRAHQKLATVQQILLQFTQHLNNLSAQGELFVNADSQVPAGDAELASAKAGKYVGVYLDTNGEYPTKLLIQILLDQGYRVCAPIIDTEAIRMTWVKINDVDYSNAENFTYNGYDIAEPRINAAQPVVPPEYIFNYVIPLVACDKTNNRIGMGKGYFDRYFSYLEKVQLLGKVNLIGLGYSWQFVPNIYQTSFDKPVNRLVLGTEAF